MASNLDLMTMLRRARLAAGLTQEELARRVKVTQTTVSAWEAGQNMPRPRMFPRIAKVLGIDPLDLTKFVSPERKDPAGAA